MNHGFFSGLVVIGLLGTAACGDTGEVAGSCTPAIELILKPDFYPCVALCE